MAGSVRFVFKNFDAGNTPIVWVLTPSKGDLWFEFGELCSGTSSIESEAMLDDDQSDDDSISTTSMLSLHISEDAINEPYPFSLVGVDLLEENMLEDNFNS